MSPIAEVNNDLSLTPILFFFVVPSLRNRICFSVSFRSVQTHVIIFNVVHTKASRLVITTKCVDLILITSSTYSVDDVY